MAAAWTDFARGVDNLLQPVLTHSALTPQEPSK
jgi:hypothetical protein